jgi:hypothetical protein
MGAGINLGNMDSIEVIVDKAHEICSELLLFAAISMKDDEIRHFLNSHQITRKYRQKIYLYLVKEYDRQTGGIAL